MFVDAGELRERIQILQRTTPINDAGYPAPAAEPKVVRTCWAKFSRSSGTEVVKAGAELSVEKGRFLIRWSRTEITPGMFVRYRGRDYEIKYVNDYEDRHEYVELWYERQAKEGKR